MGDLMDPYPEGTLHQKLEKSAKNTKNSVFQFKIIAEKKGTKNKRKN